MIVNHFKIITVIADVGSFSAASKILYVSQPYLTKIVKNIEATYDIVIFKRNKKGIELTKNGKVFIEKVRNVLDHIDSLKYINKGKNKNTIDLTISSFPSTYSMQAYVDFYKYIKNKNDLSRCHYYEKNTIDVIEDVCMHFCDLGIISVKNLYLKQNSIYFTQKEIVFEKIFDLEPHIMCRKDHPLLDKKKIELSDLYNYNLAVFENSYAVNSLVFDEGYYNHENLSHVINFDKFKHITYVNSRGAILSLLHNSNKIAIGNCVVNTDNSVFGLTFIPLKKFIKKLNLEQISNSMYCIYLKERTLPKQAYLYLNFLKESHKKK